MAKKPLVVIIDDDKDSRQFLEIYLQKMGCSTMSTIDGLEVCRKLKEDGNTRDIPVIMLSVLNKPSNVVSATEAGADDYIVKPIKEEVLRQKLLKYITPFSQT